MTEACRWGPCTGLAVGERWHYKRGTLPVCEGHLGPDDLRPDQAEEFVRRAVAPAVLSPTEKRFRFTVDDLPPGDTVEFTEHAEPGFNDAWQRWLAEVTDVEGHPDPDVQRYWNFVMGRSTEDVTLVQLDTQGVEQKRWLLHGCRCTDSPEQRMARGEPPYEEADCGAGIEVTRCQVRFERREGDDDQG
jgi:hypothetical protein